MKIPPQAKRSTVTCPATNTNTSVPSVWGPGDLLASRPDIFRGLVCKKWYSEWWWPVMMRWRCLNSVFLWLRAFHSWNLCFLFNGRSEPLILLRSTAHHFAFWFFAFRWFNHSYRVENDAVVPSCLDISIFWSLSMLKILKLFTYFKTRWKWHACLAIWFCPVSACDSWPGEHFTSCLPSDLA